MTDRKFINYALVALFLLSLGFMALGRPFGFHWDFFVFIDAVNLWRKDLNPYDFSLLNNLEARYSSIPSFTYAPLTIPLFAPFVWMPIRLAVALWVLLKFLALLGFFRQWQKIDSFSWNSTPLWLILFFGFNGTLISDFASGNISIFQVLLIYWGIAELFRGRGVNFGFGVGIPAVFKIQPIALTILPWILQVPNAVRASLIAPAFFCFFFLCNYFTAPDLFQLFWVESFIRVNAESGILNPSSLAFTQDLTKKILQISFVPESWSAPLRHLALLGYLCFVAAIGIFGGSDLLAVRRYLKNAQNQERLRLALLYFSLTTYLLVIPRVKSYEFILILPALYFCLREVKESLRYLFLLFFCLPVVFMMGGTEEVISSFHLGVIKKGFVLFYQYLPLWQTLVLWLWFRQYLLREVSQAPNRGSHG